MANSPTRRSKPISRWTWWISSLNLISARLMVGSRSRQMSSIFSAPIQIKLNSSRPWIRISKICLILDSQPSSSSLISIACLAMHPKSLLLSRQHKTSFSAFTVSSLLRCQSNLFSNSKIRLIWDSANSSSNTKRSSNRLILDLRLLEISHPHHSNSSKTRSTYLLECVYKTINTL